MGLNDIIQIMIKAEYIPECSNGKQDSGFVSDISDSEHSTSGSNSSEAVVDIDDKPSTSTQQGIRGTYKVVNVGLFLYFTLLSRSKIDKYLDLYDVFYKGLEDPQHLL